MIIFIDWGKVRVTCDIIIDIKTVDSEQRLDIKFDRYLRTDKKEQVFYYKINNFIVEIIVEKKELEFHFYICKKRIQYDSENILITEIEGCAIHDGTTHWNTITDQYESPLLCIPILDHNYLKIKDKWIHKIEKIPELINMSNKLYEDVLDNMITDENLNKNFKIKIIY